jgi:hypothetical protein
MKKVLIVSLLLALVMTMVMPTAALAARPCQSAFSAEGYLTGIDTGNVRELGRTGYWLVRDRHITGQFTDGDMGNAPFVLTYSGIFALQTQAGDLVGKLESGRSTLLVTASVQPLSMVDMGGFSLPCLTIEGQWIGVKNLRASGSFQASLIFVPTADGHVDYIVASSMVMSGKYLGRR